MQTNFFQAIAELKLKGDMLLCISEIKQGTFTVSCMLKNNCADPAARHIIPFCLTGNSDELDEGFFDALGQPLSQASRLLDNMENFDRQLKVAQQNSKMEQEKDKAYKEVMAKVEELFKAEKYREAYMKIPETKRFPNKAQELQKRKAEISAMFQQPSLFISEVANP